MNEVIEVHVKYDGKTHLVSHLRYIRKSPPQEFTV